MITGAENNDPVLFGTQLKRIVYNKIHLLLIVN